LKEATKRTLLNLVRSPQALGFQIFAVIFFGLLIGLLYYQIDTSFASGLQNR